MHTHTSRRGRESPIGKGPSVRSRSGEEDLAKPMADAKERPSSSRGDGKVQRAPGSPALLAAVTPKGSISRPEPHIQPNHQPRVRPTRPFTLTGTYCTPHALPHSTNRVAFTAPPTQAPLPPPAGREVLPTGPGEEMQFPSSRTEREANVRPPSAKGELESVPSALPAFALRCTQAKVTGEPRKVAQVRGTDPREQRR